TLADIGQNAPADVALRIGREWKVGKIGNPGDPTRNAGAVILLVPKETSSDGRGHCYVATGNGAEGFITDAEAGTICRQATPFFKQRDYGRGLALVTLLTAQRFANEFKFTLDTSLHAPEPVGQPVGTGQGGGIPPQLIFLGIVFVIIMLSNLGRGRRGCGGCIPIFVPFGGGGWGGGSGGGGWGGGGGGGGFGGFGGGGGFSGGGGGSSW
ncbi:MAG TPA: TPM domain-containing protein, partial [Candidatus Elarobacter sp.]|nr:TPM domain-containing protein [Candidatus Elarobacter sp.]